MKKRVCIFSAQYLPSSYGVEKYTFHLAEKLSEKGIEVTIITSDLYGAKVYEENGNVRIFRLPAYGLMNNRFPIIKYNREFRTKIKEIFTAKYDLCITNTRFYPLSLLGAVMGRKHAKRNILIEHGTSHIEMGNRMVKYCGEMYEHFITFLVKQNVRDFYGVSKDCNQWLEHFGIRAKGVLNNAIDKKEIDAIGADKSHEKLKEMQGNLLITFTGRLIKEKGVLPLIRAFQSIEEKYPYIRLVIAGDGPLMAELKEKCGRNVFLMGRISFEEVIDILRESDIFCFPSEYAEGMPTSLLEAAVCQNSIISTRCGGATEIVPDESYGILLKDNSEEEIRNALEKMLTDDEYRKRTARKVCLHVENNFVWEKIADKVCKEFL